MVSLASLTSFAFRAPFFFGGVVLGSYIINVFWNSFLLSYGHVRKLIGLVKVACFNNCIQRVVYLLRFGEASKFLEIVIYHELLFLCGNGFRNGDRFYCVWSTLVLWSSYLGTVFTNGVLVVQIILKSSLLSS